MVNPCPGYGVTTPYGKRGSNWSCDEDSSGNGVHTGADFAAPAGTKVVACRAGEVVWVNFGSAFGNHQFVVRHDDGTQTFYAHTTTRPANSSRVDTGQAVAKVGEEGNATGPHLHLELHDRHSGSWSCSCHCDPEPAIEWEDELTISDEDLERIADRVWAKAKENYDGSNWTMSTYLYWIHANVNKVLDKLS